MWFLYLIAIVIALVIDYFISMKFADIAEMKGHVGDTYFWFTFIFGIVGMLMVIALPVQTGVKDHKTTTTLTPQKDIFASVKGSSAANTVKRCPHCGDIVKLGRCEMCGKEVK
jgi:predicted RNA-binding Zn-ribbon protein involved in translation (DUF1610 family)